MDEIAKQIVADAPKTTLQRAVDLCIDDIDYWLCTKRYRLAVLADALNAAGVANCRRTGQPLTLHSLGGLLSRARRRAGKPAPAAAVPVQAAPVAPAPAATSNSGPVPGHVPPAWAVPDSAKAADPSTPPGQPTPEEIERARKKSALLGYEVKPIIKR